MRLNRLDLTRYGRFSDAQITFPAPKTGEADVTVIYGPNEAGKSTTFAAYLELLFGMKARDHPYEFRFKRADLLVGAELELPNRGRVTVQRNSKKMQSLLDGQGRPIEETYLTAALHGLGRDDYVERFSLNDDGLRKGGERIANAQGDLGQLLHAGVSGLTGMAATLDQMSKRADQFHKKKGRSTALKLAKDRLTTIDQELRATSLTPDRAGLLSAATEKATAAFNEAEAELGNARLRAAASGAALVWYNQSEAIRRIDEPLGEFPSGPNLRKGAAEMVAGLVETIKQKTLRIAEAEAALAEIEKMIAENPVDDVADALAAELAQLDRIRIDGAPLMVRAAAAASDLDKRIMRRAALDEEIAACLLALGVPDETSASLVLQSSEVETLGQAAQAVLTAQGDAHVAHEALALAISQQGDASPEPQDLSQLQVAWDAWQAVADVTVEQSTVATETARLALAVVGLPTNWSTLVEAGLPTRETLLDVAIRVPAMNADLVSANTDCVKHASELALAQAKRQADEVAPTAIDIKVTTQARRLRAEKWTAHRTAMSSRTADEFEVAMHDDDDMLASFAIGTGARRDLATARRDEAAAQVLRDAAQGRLDAIKQEHDKLETQSSALAISLGLAPDSSPAAFTERHAALMQAAQTAVQLEIAQTGLTAKDDRRMAVQSDLRAVAKLVGIDCAMGELSTRTHAELTLQDSAREAWAQWLRTSGAIKKMEEKVQEAASGQGRADHRLTELTAGLPLEGRTAQDINAALPHLRNLQRLHGDLDDLNGRIAALENAMQQIGASAGRVTKIAGDIFETDPLVAIEKGRIRVTKSQGANTRRDEANRRHTAETAARNAANGAIDDAQAEISDWFKDQGAANMAPAARVAVLGERDEMRSTRASHDLARNVAKEGAKTVLFDEELALLPDASRAAAVQQILEDAQSARETRRDEYREAERLYQAAFEAADRSELATERATIQEELRAGVRQAAVLRLGVLAAKGALRRLASERRTTMLSDVEEAFVAITAPAWKGVSVWSEAEDEKLVGIQPDGKAVPVEMMSTGTMGQLYFALRVAGYRSFARDFGPLPMILDDIMETFDDARAKAALQLCADIGRSGQAIIFTHHTHLVELARETIPGVNVVDMPL